MADVSPRMPDANGYKGALFIVAAVSCLLVGLVALRFFCNIAIDVCILGDVAAARRSIRDCWSFIFGPFSRRTREVADQSTQADGGDNANLDTLMHRLSSQEKVLLLDSVLTRKVVTIQDLSAWNDTKDDFDCELVDSSGREATQRTVSDSSEVCSICLVDFEIGQEIGSTNACQHVFHHKCIFQWLALNDNTACPYCRADVITLADVKRTLHLLIVPHGP